MGNPDDDSSLQKFANLDLRQLNSFGYSKSKWRDWVKMAHDSISNGWSTVDLQEFEECLAHNVQSTYLNITSMVFEDIDTSMNWRAYFINDKSLWCIEMLDSPNAEIEPDDKKAFIESEAFKKAVRKAAGAIDNAKNKFNQVVKTHLDNGELLEVDEVKLAAILFWIDNKYFMDNFRSGKCII